MHTGCRLSTAPRPLSHRVHMVSFLFACLLWRHVYRNRALWYKELEDSGQKTCIKPHEPHPSPSVFRGTEADADNLSAIRFHSAFLLFFVLFSASSASDTHRLRLVCPRSLPGTGGMYEKTALSGAHPLPAHSVRSGSWRTPF